MGTVITILIVLLFAFVIIAKLMNSIQKSAQKMQGKGKCTSCGSRMKAVNGKYMPNCSKCGAAQ